MPYIIILIIILPIFLFLYFKNINKIKVIQYENGNYGVIKRNWWLRTQFFCFCNVDEFEYLNKRAQIVSSSLHCQEHYDLDRIKKVLSKHNNNFKVINSSFILSPDKSPTKTLISESFE